MNHELYYQIKQLEQHVVFLHAQRSETQGDAITPHDSMSLSSLRGAALQQATHQQQQAYQLLVAKDAAYKSIAQQMHVMQIYGDARESAAEEEVKRLREEVEQVSACNTT